MEFETKIRELAQRTSQLKNSLKTEEATKTSLIMPFFQALGYDVFNPNEFTPEFTADVGIKKGEKVDYAIILNDVVSILIEAKAVNEKLEKHDSQLYRYFGTSKAKFAILTNGLIYKFYTDLEKQNVMDTTPFLEINMEDLSDNDIQQLQKFKKENYDTESILSTASNLKYVGLIKKIVKEEMNNPSDDFVKLLLGEGIYNGVKTNAVVEKFRPLVKRAINLYFNDLINNKLQNALNDNEVIEEIQEESKIQTTEEELQAYHIVQAILSEFCNPCDIGYKDTISYFGVLYENKVTKWICRFYFKESVMYMTISDENKNEIRYDLQSITDIYKYRNELIQSLEKYRLVTQK